MPWLSDLQLPDYQSLPPIIGWVSMSQRFRVRSLGFRSRAITAITGVPGKPAFGFLGLDVGDSGDPWVPLPLSAD